MKLKSLILGSVAAAGLSTAGFAADLGVLTSLDVCDELGLSGLTISSDTNCLQISGAVNYEFNWGNYDGKYAIVPGIKNIDVASPAGGLAGDNDWGSKVEALLKFVGTASSDFGPASVVLNIRSRDYTKVENGYTGLAGTATNPTAADIVDGDAHAIKFQDAYVTVGDTTVLAAGKKGSIFNDGDDEPFNFTGLFLSEDVDDGVSKGAPKTGGHVIQLWSNIGEGLIAKIGLEALEKTDATAGTLVGVLDYAGSGITAHISGAAGGLLDGIQTTSDTYAVHAGFTGTFDQFKLRAALGAGGAYVAGGNSSYWNALISGEAKFDMFKVALSAEAAGGNVGGGAANLPTGYGFGGSFGATVSEGIEINIGGRYFDTGVADQAAGYQVAAQLIAALTETVKLTTEIGVYGHGADGAAAPAPVRAAYSDFYGKAELAWTPGGGFSSSVGATVQQNGAYKVTFKAAKAFQ